MPFYHLYTGDLKQLAKTLSCHQPIASDSAFSLAMVAEFSENGRFNAVALPPFILGMRSDRAGAVPGSGSRRHSRYRYRLLF